MGAFFRDTRERGLKALVVCSLSAMMSNIYAVFGRFSDCKDTYFF